jgi:LacI family transcriptional regulator
MAKSKTTIADVARAVGVSPTAVSLILNDKGSFSAATKARVREAVARMGYSPSRTAAGLRTGKTRTVGMIMTGSTDPLWASQWVQVTAKLMVEAAEELNRHGYAMLIIPSSALDWISQDEVDAIILSDSLHDDPALNTAFERGIPVLTNDRLEDDRVSVHIDCGYREMARFAWTHFMDAGRTRPGLLTVPPIFASDSAAEEVWRKLCRERGVDALVEHVAYDRHNLEEAVVSLLDRGVDAIYSFAGEGVEVADIVTRSGKQIGVDIELYSAEMGEGAEITARGATVLRYHAHEGATRAVQALLSVLETPGPTPKTVALGWECLEPTPTPSTDTA